MWAAAYYAGVRSLVYNVPAGRLTTLLEAALGVLCRDVLASAPVKMVGPVFEEPGVEIIRQSDYAVVD
jgi:hypothetical protein